MVSRIFTFRSSLPALSALGLAGVFVLWVPASANPAPAGIVIESTAEVTYSDAGVNRSATSNTVRVRVDELVGVAAATLNSGPVTARSGPAVLSFLVSNTGNGPEAFSIEVVTAVAGNAFDAAPDGLAVDSNGNGVYDPGVDLPLAPPSITAIIPAGGSQTLFALVTVPTGAADGAQTAVNLIARSATGTGSPGTVIAGAGEGGVDAVVGPGGGMAVADLFGGSTASPGATITYGIQALVSGSATIDGLVVTDAIPANTRYLANSLTLESAPVSDAPGDDAGEASAAGITVNLGSLPAGTSRTVSFAVQIEE
jgi:uncharacterized repeat protein (TIGR01451 family)